MNSRNFRIVWSVAWGVVALLLVVLWVRSYWHTDSLTRVGNDLIFQRIGTDYGILFFGWSDYKETPHIPPVDLTDGWEYQEFDGKPIPGIVPPWAFEWNTRGALVSLPAWFATALSLMVATAPWLTWRFSLRTLLIATTLIALVLGIIVWMSRVG
jgi:hypothetical protein